MAKFDCDNIGKNWPSLLRLEREGFVRRLPRAEPKPEDLELATRWLRERPQSDLDEADEFYVDPTGEFLGFAAQQLGSITAEQSSRLRQAYRVTLTRNFARATRLCSTRREESGEAPHRPAAA